MATQAERQINDLKLEINTLKERVETLRGETSLLRDITNRLAVAEHRLDELSKSQERWGQRGWVILTIGLSALCSLAAAVLTYYLTRPR